MSEPPERPDWLTPEMVQEMEHMRSRPYWLTEERKQEWREWRKANDVYLKKKKKEERRTYETNKYAEMRREAEERQEQYQKEREIQIERERLADPEQSWGKPVRVSFSMIDDYGDKEPVLVQHIPGGGGYATWGCGYGCNTGSDQSIGAFGFVNVYINPADRNRVYDFGGYVDDYKSKPVHMEDWLRYIKYHIVDESGDKFDEPETFVAHFRVLDDNDPIEDIVF